MGPTLEQYTQVKANDIDQETRQIEIDNWQKEIVNTPALIENHDIVTNNNKPREINFNRKAFINYTAHPIPEDVAIILSMGPKFSVPVEYTKT